MNLLESIGCLCAVVILVVVFRDLGYKCGVKDGTLVGYERGRVDAENWWLNAGRGVDEARQAIWRSEERKERS